MKKNRLADSPLEVTDLCLGTMTWGEQNTEAEAHAQIECALAHGVNFIDTAEMYPVPPRRETQGTTERFIGSWIARNRGRRGDFVLASKIAGPGRRDWIRDGDTRVSARTVKASPPSEMTPPPAFSVFLRTARSSSDIGTPALASLARSGSTSIWRSCPPMTLTSASPGVERRAGRTRVSCSRRSSRRRVASSAGAFASAV